MHYRHFIRTLHVLMVYLIILLGQGGTILDFITANEYSFMPYGAPY